MMYDEIKAPDPIDNEKLSQIRQNLSVAADAAAEESVKPAPASEEKPYWVYILVCQDGSLYTGIALDPFKRLTQHNAGKGAKYTKNRRPCRMVYREEMPSKGEALRREYAIKKLSRTEKLSLIKDSGTCQA